MKMQTGNITLFIFIVCILIIFIIGFRHEKHKNKNVTDTIETTESEVVTTIENIESDKTTDESMEDTETTESKEESTEIITTVIEETSEAKTEETETTKDKEPKLVSLGEFRLTAYCACEECCDEWAHIRPNGVIVGAIMEPLVAGYSIAVDPNVIPYRTEVVINGHTYKAQDCGGGIKGNRIDIYMDSHEEACDFGVQHAEVFMVVE